MKTKILASLLLFLSINAFAQLRVDPYGRIGMGTNYPNSEYKCHIKGDLLLTTYPEIPAPNATFVEFKFKVGHGWPGADNSIISRSIKRTTRSYRQHKKRNGPK